MKNVDDIYSLSPVQQSMLAHALGGADSGTLAEQLSCQLDGALDFEKFKLAWQSTLAHHDVLRTCLLWDGLKEPLQVVRSEVELPCKVEDLRQLSPEDQAARYQGLRQFDHKAGFDLTKAPLMRLLLVRMGESTWRLLWTCHHLILDGLSVPLVFRDAMTAYATIEPVASQQSADRRSTSKGSRSFRKYLAWLNQQDTSKSEDYWKSALADLPALRPLPVARPPKPFAARQDSKQSSQILTATETQRLLDTAAELMVSLNVVVQGAWALLLSRYSGENDIVFGIGMSGRPDSLPGVSEIVGPMSTVLPLRVRTPLDEPCDAWLKDLHATQSDLQEHQYARLEDIAHWADLHPSRRLFDTMMVFEGHASAMPAQLGIGDLTISEIQGTASSGYPLTLVVVPGNELELRAMFDPAVFDDAVSARMLEHLRNLLHAIAANPHGKLGDLQLISPEEQRALVSCESESEFQLVLDHSGQVAPFGIPGRLYRTQSVSETAAGEVATVISNSAKKLAFIPTNQRAVRHSDGTLELLGPVDAPLRIGIYGIDPEAVAAAIKGNQFVADAAVIGQLDRQGQMQLAAFIVPAREANLAIAQETGSLVVSRVRQDVLESLETSMVPCLWCVVDRIPRNPDGAVDDKALPLAAQPRDSALGEPVLPRNETEMRLAEAWTEILGVEPIGVEDSFLDLGGDSLSAVALLSRLEEDFGCKLPLVSLFQRPTVAHLATLLNNPVADGADNTLVPLRTEGEEAPLFCVHPAGGTVFCYLEFAKSLSDGFPVYGIQAQGLDGLQPPHDSLEAMAAHYAKSIKAQQPQGPYHICGWSSGGVLAYELACQLEETGEEVSLLALFDAGIPRPGETFDENDILPMLGLMFPGESPEQIEELHQASPERQMEFFQERAEAAQILFAGSAGTQIQHVYHVFQANMAAVVAFQPREFSGRALLFRASERATPMHEDPQLGWGPWVAGGIEVHEVPGSHLSMFQSPGVEHLTATLNEYLEREAVR